LRDDGHESDDAAEYYKDQRERDILAGIDSESSESSESEEVDLQRYGIRGLPAGKQDSDDEPAKVPAVTWGQKKSKFYNAEEGWSEDEDIRKEEEEEALRLRKEQLGKFSEQDFLDDFARPDVESDHDDLDLPAVAPAENTQLVDDLKRMLQDATKHITTEIEPILQFCSQVLQAKPKVAGKRRQRKGPRLTPAEQQALEYLALKRRILLDYMTHVTFALLLLTNGESMQNHACIAAISDKRSQLRICSHVESEALTIISGQDEQSMKTQQDDLWTPFEWETLSDEKQQREDARLAVPLFQNAVSDGLERLAVWYRSFVETGLEDRPAFLDFDQEQDFEDLLNQSDSQSADSELDGMQLESDSESGTEAVMDTLDEIFVPLTGKNKVKKARVANDLNDDVLADKLLSKVEGLEKKEKKQSSRFVVGRVVQTLNKPRVSKLVKHGMGDADVPYRTAEKEQQAQASQMGVEEAIKKRHREETENLHALKYDKGRGIDADDAALEFYNKHAKKADEKKQLIVEGKHAKAMATLGDYDEEYDLGQKRGASKQILLNRGLAPRTKKINRNPRVKKRVKYAKAMTKMETSVRKSYKPGQSGSYGGEATGIKTNVSKSVRFGSSR